MPFCYQNVYNELLLPPFIFYIGHLKNNFIETDIYLNINLDKIRFSAIYSKFIIENEKGFFGKGKKNFDVSFQFYIQKIQTRNKLAIFGIKEFDEENFEKVWSNRHSQWLKNRNLNLKEKRENEDLSITLKVN